MRKTAVNPYLPLWEHIPDGEPHIFEDRLYIYGSHDADDGDDFCLLDYAGWSAPLDDLGNWRYEGIIYRADQDPLYHSGTVFTPPHRQGKPHLMFAPDAAKGCDGRYYLYYSIDFSNIISVAVCDRPSGPFEFYGHVALPDGTYPADIQFFDPAVYVEEEKVYLYVGSAPTEHYLGTTDKPIEGAMVMQLAKDMKTIITTPHCVANGIETAKGTSFEEHPFFEASSLRHYNNWYYFIYSSLQGHELCYAMGQSPEGPFEYKGVLISNGDIGYKGNTQPVCYMGNNHGSIAQINDAYYIFWHRHTHGGQFSRQGCADRIQLQEDGTFLQAEVTSCGLNGGALPSGSYSAAIASAILGPDRIHMGMLPLKPQNTPDSTIPYVTGCYIDADQQTYLSWIENLRSGAALGYKYFKFDSVPYQFTIKARGFASLSLRLDSEDNEPLVTLTCGHSDWTIYQAGFMPPVGTHAVYITVTGDSDAWADLAEFQFTAI